ncbi:MAG: S8 family serine peptidase [Flavobacteriales bacterium]|jgi:subtilisin family serine protease|nr:S8 family serine peptidase [Flavobacteriales bacterium]
MNWTSKVVAFSLLMGSSVAMAQHGNTEVDKDILNWYNNSKTGVRTDKAYAELLKGRKSKPTVVGVIDSGVDIEHEDLKGKIWVNKGEIPNNGIDDDKNGYIDDIHGWNFLGNADGRNANDAQLEVTRIYARLMKKFDGKEESEIAKADLKDYKYYLKVKEVVTSKRESAKAGMDRMKSIQSSIEKAHSKMVEKYGEDYTAKDITKEMEETKMSDPKQKMAFASLENKDAMLERLKGGLDYFSGQYNYYYNPDFTGDRDIIGDKPSDFSDTQYGNGDVEGPDAGHGTHCAGIIGANRGNGIGNDGVADNAIIMSLRAVPNGDERDKDIALAIRYAVDNGAQVVSMSFGKDYPENSAEVIKAIRYAEKKGVLLVHAAGNDGKDVDVEPKFPTSMYPSMSERFTNWLDIGAATRFEKPQYKKMKRDKWWKIWKKRKKVKTYNGRAASFSNYGDKKVDIFAPGKEIYSTIPQSDYATFQGTSMACPMVSGLAALLKSYFPELTMFEIRDIILKSANRDDFKVIKPGKGKKGPETVKFSSLSREGGIIDVYNAVKMAIEKTSK